MSIALPATFQVEQILPAKISLQMLPNASQLLSLFTSAACFTSSSTPAAELQVPTNGCPSRFVAFGSEPHLFDMLFMIPSNAPYRILIGWLFFSAFKLDVCYYYMMIGKFPFPRLFHSPDLFFWIHFVGEGAKFQQCGHRFHATGGSTVCCCQVQRSPILSSKVTCRYMFAC